MPNNNDILDDLDFDLPPLKKLKKPGTGPDTDDYEPPAPEKKPEPPRHIINPDDILSAPDAPDEINPAVAFTKPAPAPAPAFDPFPDPPAPAPAPEPDPAPSYDSADSFSAKPQDNSSSPAPEGSVRQNFDIFGDSEDEEDPFDLPPSTARKPEAEAKPKPSPKLEEEFVGSYEQKNKGNFTIGDDDDDDDDPDSSYDNDLSGIDKSTIQLDDMDKTPASTREGREAAKALRQQVLFDDISMGLEKMPVLEDLSNEYTSMKDKVKNDDLVMKKGKLEENERKAIQDHLREEINRRPENFNKHASMAMANHLAEERRLKKAKKGFLLTIPVLLMALASAAATYIGIGTSDLEYATLFKYISFGTVVFSLMILIKSKHLKALSSIYFILNTVALLGPGLIMHVLGQKDLDPEFNKHIIFYLIAAVLSGVAAFVLCTNDTIHTYYTTDTNGRKR